MTAPASMAGHDSSIFIAWIKAITDVMLSQGRAGHLAEETLPDIGGLLFALTQAAEELSVREVKEARAKS